MLNTVSRLNSLAISLGDNEVCKCGSRNGKSLWATQCRGVRSDAKPKSRGVCNRSRRRRVQLHSEIPWCRILRFALGPGDFGAPGEGRHFIDPRQSHWIPLLFLSFRHPRSIQWECLAPVTRPVRRESHECMRSSRWGFGASDLVFIFLESFVFQMYHFCLIIFVQNNVSFSIDIWPDRHNNNSMKMKPTWFAC